MNYREWLVHRAHQHAETATEGEVLRYSTWRNTQALRDWHRRVDAAHLSYAAQLHYAGARTRAERPAV